MPQKLNGQRIALFESRLAEEISALVRRCGGVPVCVPAVREHRRSAGREMAAVLDRVRAEPSPVFVFSTGVGASALFGEARALGREAELRDAILRGLAVCRGPKPVAALHKEGITASIRARSPYTTEEFIDALAQVDVRRRMVVLTHYGEKNPPLVVALVSRGARLFELMLYEWELPEDTGPLARVIEELEGGAFAAAAFTTQIQARNLMAVAGEVGRKEGLLAALRSRVLVAAVGPTCARVLKELGIPPQVMPESPKMAAMIRALVGRLAEGSPQ